MYKIFSVIFYSVILHIYIHVYCGDKIIDLIAIILLLRYVKILSSKCHFLTCLLVDPNQTWYQTSYTWAYRAYQLLLGLPDTAESCLKLGSLFACMDIFLQNVKWTPMIIHVFCYFEFTQTWYTGVWILARNGWKLAQNQLPTIWARTRKTNWLSPERQEKGLGFTVQAHQVDYRFWADFHAFLTDLHTPVFRLLVQ